jgi:hypothetical protein
MTTAGLQPILEADLRDPRSMGLSDIADPRLDRLTMPTIEPDCTPIAAVKGTAEVAVNDPIARRGNGGFDPLESSLRTGRAEGSAVLLT